MCLPFPSMHNLTMLAVRYFAPPTNYGRWCYFSYFSDINEVMCGRQWEGGDYVWDSAGSLLSLSLILTQTFEKRRTG